MSNWTISVVSWPVLGFVGSHPVIIARTDDGDVYQSLQATGSNIGGIFGGQLTPIITSPYSQEVPNTEQGEETVIYSGSEQDVVSRMDAGVAAATIIADDHYA
jgi:hypothetical protein